MISNKNLKQKELFSKYVYTQGICFGDRRSHNRTDSKIKIYVDKI